MPRKPTPKAETEEVVSAGTKEMTDQTEVLDLSVQKRAEQKLLSDSLASVTWFVGSSEEEIAPWWSEERDKDLRDFVLKEGNDILQGAVSSMVKKFRAMNWVLEGPEGDEDDPLPGTVRYHQPILAESEFGDGWSTLLGKVLYDYHTQDKGAFVELIGEGEPTEPIPPPGVMGLAHLDAGRCQLTGDATYPVLFQSPKSGNSHKLHATRVIHMADMPSPQEHMKGTGFCGVSRVIASSQVLLRLAKYKNEKLSDLPQAGLLLFNNLLPSKWSDAEAEYQHGNRRVGHELWKNIMTLFGYDPNNPITAEFISFAGLPDAFDESSTTEIYVNILALAFGVDVREFWPMSAGPLGTATETLVQHQKAKGKGVGDVISTVERAINWKVLPSTVSFRFDFRDDEEDEQSANINRTKVDTIMRMWRPPFTAQIEAGISAPVSGDEIRQMLADNVDYFKEDFLTIDVTTETEATDTDQAWWRGPQVWMDSKGVVKRAREPGGRGAKVKRQVDRALELAEANYRAGSVSAEDVAEFALSELLERRTDG
jgi:hypothetical protein